MEGEGGGAGGAAAPPPPPPPPPQIFTKIDILPIENGKKVKIVKKKN